MPGEGIPSHGTGADRGDSARIRPRSLRKPHRADGADVNHRRYPGLCLAPALPARLAQARGQRGWYLFEHVALGVLDDEPSASRRVIGFPTSLKVVTSTSSEPSFRSYPSWLCVESRITGLPQGEGQHVGRVAVGLRPRRVEASVAGVVIYTQQHRLAAGTRRLQARRILRWDPRGNSLIVGASVDQHRRIFHAVLHVRVRTHRIQRLEASRRPHIAELGNIIRPVGGGLKAQHVSRWYADHHGTKQVGTLLDRAADQDAAGALGPAEQFARIGVPASDQVLRAGDEVLPGIRLARLVAGLVPSFAQLTATAYVREGNDGAAVVPRAHGRNVEGREADAVGAVTCDHREVPAVELDSPFMDDGQWHPSTIPTLYPNFLDGEIVGMVISTGRLQAIVRDLAASGIDTHVRW